MRKAKKIRVNYIDYSENKGKQELIDCSKLAPEDQYRWVDFFNNYMKKIHETKDFTKQRKIEFEVFNRKEDPKSFELRSLLIIGPKRHKGYHFSEKMFTTFRNKGYLVDYSCPEDLRDDNFDKYISKEKRFSLTKVLKYCRFTPDLILIDECHFHWDNDVNMTVFYHQREFKRPPTVYHPDVIFFWREGFIKYWKNIFAPGYMNKVKHHEVLPLSINKDFFKPEKKKYLGIIGIGFREELNWVLQASDLATSSDTELIRDEEIKFKALGFKYFDTPIDDDLYHSLLPTCDILWIPIAKKQYLSHRMFEAMACKTICLIRIQDAEHEQVLADLGFLRGKHYIGCDSIEKFKELDLKKIDLELIRENAYNLVQEKYTDDHVADHLVNLYNELGFQGEKYDVICPVYWTNEFFKDNVRNWFKELPIRKLYLGVNNPNIHVDVDHPDVEIINQTKFKTLGKCLADLMKKVKTRWFIYLHSDAKITPNAFQVMKIHKGINVGIIESERREWNGQMRYASGELIKNIISENYHDRRRSFSGFQLIRTKVIEDIIEKIEDDFIYRNEDLIFQSECKRKGYTYEKSFAMHEHQILNTEWTFDWEETHQMQWKGLVKYAEPDDVTIFSCINPIKELRKKGLSLSKCLYFCFEHNPNWGAHIRKAFLEWEQLEGKVMKS